MGMDLNLFQHIDVSINKKWSELKIQKSIKIKISEVMSSNIRMWKHCLPMDFNLIVG